MANAQWTQMGHGAYLNIFNGSHLFSCTGMWQGIINNWGTVNIIESLFEDAKEAINNNNSSLAFQKLSAMVNQNTIDENNNYMAMLVALGYDASLDADSDTIVVVNNIAMMHPFYGGEAVYIARAMLHLNIADILPPLRRQHKNVESLEIVKTTFSLIPNPATTEVSIFSTQSFINTKLQLYDYYGSLVSNLTLPDNTNSFTLDVNNLVGGIYFTFLKSDIGITQMTKLVIIK